MPSTWRTLKRINSKFTLVSASFFIFLFVLSTPFLVDTTIDSISFSSFSSKIVRISSVNSSVSFFGVFVGFCSSSSNSSSLKSEKSSRYFSSAALGKLCSRVNLNWTSLNALSEGTERLRVFSGILLTKSWLLLFFVKWRHHTVAKHSWHLWRLDSHVMKSVLY